MQSGMIVHILKYREIALYAAWCMSVLLFPTMKSQGSAKNEANNAAKTATVAPAETEKVDFSNVKIEPIFEEMNG